MKQVVHTPQMSQSDLEGDQNLLDDLQSQRVNKREHSHQMLLPTMTRIIPSNSLVYGIKMHLMAQSIHQLPNGFLKSMGTISEIIQLYLAWKIFQLMLLFLTLMKLPFLKIAMMMMALEWKVMDLEE